MIAWLALCTTLFVGLHLVGSSARVRESMVRRFGAQGQQGLLAALLAPTMIGMIWTWSRAPTVILWTPAPWQRWVPLVVMPVALIMVVAGYSTRSGTQTGQSSVLARGPVGIQTLTRHPANWGITLWAVAHLFPNGDLAALLFFGGFATLGIVGSLHIDQRRARTDPETWPAYAAQTSFVPGLALLQGRCHLDLRGLGWWRIALGLGAYGLMLHAHTWIIGASPLP